jgi:caffeoyl-CoA O-methyltransferase
MKDLVWPEIETYAEAHSWRESDVCRALREETYRRMEFPRMVVGPLEGAFLKMMAQMVQAKQVLEVGTFTGYSALCFAEALPDEGRVITCDIDEQSVALAKTYWAKSPYGGKIEVRLGPAIETLDTLSGPFDLIFVDADKMNYLKYYRRALELMGPRGVILIDNVLWSGDVLKSKDVDSSTAAIQELNRIIAADQGIKAVLVTIRDGIFVVRKA